MRLFIKPFEIEFEFVFTVLDFGKSCGLIGRVEKGLTHGYIRGNRKMESGVDGIRRESVDD
jgi:hypothetical protein